MPEINPTVVGEINASLKRIAHSLEVIACLVKDENPSQLGKTIAKLIRQAEVPK